MDWKDALKVMGASGLKLSAGDVCIVEDTAVVIPATKDEERKFHENGRTCVVLSSKKLLEGLPIATIAPTSSRTDLKDASDFPLAASPQNGLDRDCLVMLAHIQPVLKSTLIRRIGTLPTDIWDKLLVHMLVNFER